MNHHHASDGAHPELGHALPFQLYLNVFIALVVLTAITVGAAYIHFGALNMVIAMVIASVKAMLVALFFMHLKYEKPTTWLYAIFPLILLAILLAGVFIDNPYRSHHEIHVPVKLGQNSATLPKAH